MADYGPAGAAINRTIVERFRVKGIVYPAPMPEMRVVKGWDWKLQRNIIVIKIVEYHLFHKHQS